MGSKDSCPKAQAPRKLRFWTFCTANGELYIGFWTGYDMDLGQVVSFPYILTKEADGIEKDKYRKMLENAQTIVQLPIATR
jgi:hypothetical protein